MTATALLALAFGWPLAELMHQRGGNVVPALLLHGLQPMAPDAVLAVDENWRLAVLAAWVAVLVAWPVARYLARARRTWVALLMVGLALPVLSDVAWLAAGLTIPPVVYGLGQLGILMPEAHAGLLERLLQSRALTWASLPFVVLVVLIGCCRRDPRWDMVAATLGAARWARLWRVSWPLSWSWLLGAWVLGGVIAAASMAGGLARAGGTGWLGIWGLLSTLCLLAYGGLARNQVDEQPTAR